MFGVGVSVVVPSVTLGTTTLTVTQSSSQQIQSTVPANALSSAETFNVSIDNGQERSADMPLVVLGTQPVIGALVPQRAVAGGDTFTLTIYGGFGAGDFALQMVKAPQSQYFPSRS
ncbi:MAG: hypothetical protein D3910_15330 [Candidatus Electrothrix sp. ATG2]|nr:hypothetical protein [Candidatus Electrothrix sp. ATG2]